jgi:hypothetical protein
MVVANPAIPGFMDLTVLLREQERLVKLEIGFMADSCCCADDEPSPF